MMTDMMTIVDEYIDDISQRYRPGALRVAAPMTRRRVAEMTGEIERIVRSGDMSMMVRLIEILDEYRAIILALPGMGDTV